jgi:hypothetical protein
MTSAVLFTTLRCGLGACQVDPDLYTSGLTTLCCVTAQAAVATKVITDTHVGIMTFLRSAYHRSNAETWAAPMLSRVLQSQWLTEMSGYSVLIYSSYKATIDLGSRPSYKIQTC